MRKNTFLAIIGIFFLWGAVPVHGITVAPKISDREIVEKLAKLETGQQNIDQRFDAVDKRFDSMEKRHEEFRNDVNRRFDELKSDVNKRFDELKSDVNRRYDELNKRYDELRNDVNLRMEQQFNLILWLGGVLVTIWVGKMGFLFSQNLQILKRLEKTVDEKQVREIIHEDKNIQNMQYALKEYAQNDENLGAILKKYRVA